MAFPASILEDAEEIIKNVKNKFYNASHHCYAFKFSDGIEKNSDGGEPNGTAGVRILNAIDHF